MPDANVMGVPFRTTNKGFTMLVLLGVVIMLSLMLQSFQVYTIEARIIDSLTLLLIGAFVGAELGVRLPSKKWGAKDGLNLVALIIVGLTMLYGVLALTQWVIPATLLGIRGLVLGIASLLALYGVFTK
jgi:hypothetical protein